MNESQTVNGVVDPAASHNAIYKRGPPSYASTDRTGLPDDHSTGPATISHQPVTDKGPTALLPLHQEEIDKWHLNVRTSTGPTHRMEARRCLGSLLGILRLQLPALTVNPERLVYPHLSPSMVSGLPQRELNRTRDAASFLSRNSVAQLASLPPHMHYIRRCTIVIFDLFQRTHNFPLYSDPYLFPNMVMTHRRREHMKNWPSSGSALRWRWHLGQPTSMRDFQRLQVDLK
ncbi:hypothetical protein BC827DRAFT_1155132 [Russula dissimulans]|nr:hypothetical protein BC827DRAFT_1155132 [Russula dissimulans]